MTDEHKQQQAVDIVTRAGESVSYLPSNPVEMEFAIRELTALIEQMPEKLLELNEARYAAERAWSRRRNTSLAQHSKNMSVTAARALADVEALVEREEADNAKAAWHYADDTARALRTKLFGMLNVNNGIHAAFRGYGVGR